jgi:hypothetical protein
VSGRGDGGRVGGEGGVWEGDGDSGGGDVGAAARDGDVDAVAASGGVLGPGELQDVAAAQHGDDALEGGGQVLLIGGEDEAAGAFAEVDEDVFVGMTGSEVDAGRAGAEVVCAVVADEADKIADAEERDAL